jgi:ABC-type amino acid transport system permease subunit
MNLGPRRAAEIDSWQRSRMVRAIIWLVRAVPTIVTVVFAVLFLLSLVAGKHREAMLALLVAVFSLSVAVRVALVREP